MDKGKKWLGCCIVMLLAVACGDESQPEAPILNFGSLNLEVSTRGGGIDPAYTLIIDGVAVGEIGSNETRTIQSLSVGSRTIELAGVAQNCEVEDPGPFTVYIYRAQQASLSVDLICRAAGPVRIAVTSNGPTEDPDGYTFGIDGAPTTPIAIDGSIQIPLVEPGRHQLRMGGLHKDCAVSSNTQLNFEVVGDGLVTVQVFITCLSFDGNRIVFASTRGGGTSQWDLEIWSTTIDGADPIRLTYNGAEDTEPAVTPGAFWLAYVRDDGVSGSEVWSMQNNGGEEWPRVGALTGNARSPVYGKNGSLAWVENIWYTNAYVLKYADSSGGGTVGSSVPTSLTRRFSPAWSADGTMLAFATDSSINLIRVNGTGESVLRRVPGVTHIAWSHESHRIVFNAPAVPDSTQPGLYGTGAWTMNETGSGLVQLMSTTPNTTWNNPRWDPSGTRLVFSRVVAGSPDSKIWRAQGDGSGAVEVAGLGNRNVHPSWP